MGLLLYVADLIAQIQLNLTTGRRNHWIIFSHSTQVCFFTLSKRPSLNVLLTPPYLEFIYRISPSISREISDNFENANLGVRPILGSRKMSSLTTRQATNMFANESSFVTADKFSEQ